MSSRPYPEYGNGASRPSDSPRQSPRLHPAICHPDPELSNGSGEFLSDSQKLLGNNNDSPDEGPLVDDDAFLGSINKRQCVAFVSSDGSQNEKTLCECGLPRDAHATSSYTHPQCTQPWQYSTHTQHSPTDAFGRIEFVGFRDKFADYIRLDVDTSPDTIIHLLTKVWHIHPPDMLISISEGTKTFNLKPRLKFAFRNGLRKITKSNSAWVMSGGIRLRLVGEAVSDVDSVTQKSVAIGIAPWGCVQEREGLINDKPHVIKLAVKSYFHANNALQGSAWKMSIPQTFKGSLWSILPEYYVTWMGIVVIYK